MTNVSASDFLPIRLGTLRADDELPFDLYLKVGDRFVRHTRQNDPLDKDRSSLLKEKGVKKGYILTSEEPKYIEYLDRSLDVLSTSHSNPQTQAEIIHSTLAQAAEGGAFAQNPETFVRTGKQVEKINEFLTSEKNAIKDFLGTAGIAQDIAQHSATVSSLSVALAAKMGITDSKQLLALGIAGLLHDIDVGPERESNPQVYLAHPTRAVETLSVHAHVSPEILDLIRHHEEMGLGQGFPEKKRIETLPLHQQIFNLCNHYDATCTRSQKNPLEAGKQFFIDKVGLFPLPVMTALSELIKV